MVQPQYDIISKALGNLSGTIRGLSAQNEQNKQNMRNLDLQKANLGLRGEQMRGEQELNKAKFDRENFMNEPVTFQQMIETSNSIDDNGKKAYLQQVPKEVLSHIALRKDWVEALRNQENEYKNRELHQQQMNLNGAQSRQKDAYAEQKMLTNLYRALDKGQLTPEQRMLLNMTDTPMPEEQSNEFKDAMKQQILNRIGSISGVTPQKEVAPKIEVKTYTTQDFLNEFGPKAK